jgi:hypothetical protein
MLRETWEKECAKNAKTPRAPRKKYKIDLSSWRLGELGA